MQMEQTNRKIYHPESYETFLLGEDVSGLPEQIRQLRIQVKLLEQQSTVEMDFSTASSIPGGSLIKKVMKKVLTATMGPVIRQQNAVNLAQQSCLNQIVQELEDSERRMNEGERHGQIGS